MCVGGGGETGSGSSATSSIPCPMSYGPGSVEAEMLHMYSQEDLLILCVRLAVLLAVTLTVPVVLFPVRGDKGGAMEQRGMGRGYKHRCLGGCWR